MSGRVILFPQELVAKDADGVAADLWRRLKTNGSVSGDDLRELGLMIVLEQAAEQWVARGFLRMEAVAGVKHFAVTPLGLQTSLWDPVISADTRFSSLRRELADFLKECGQ